MRRRLLNDVAARIAKIERPHPIRVAIDGVDCAGKTTLSDQLTAPLEALGRTVIRSSIDNFHNPAEIRYERGRSSSEGYYRDSFDTDRLRAVLLDPLGQGGSRRFRTASFDYRTDSEVDIPAKTADRNAILLFDGIFLQRRELRSVWDYSIFVKVDFLETMRRAARRDADYLGAPDDVRRLYETRYVPAQKRYLAECEPERLASVVVDNSAPDEPLIIHAQAPAVESP